MSPFMSFERHKFKIGMHLKLEYHAKNCAQDIMHFMP